MRLYTLRKSCFPLHIRWLITAGDKFKFPKIVLLRIRYRNGFSLLLLLTDFAHIRTFKLGRNDSFAVTFVPGGSTEPRVLWWTLQYFAGIASKNFAALTFAGFEIQLSSIDALFTSTPGTLADSTHVWALAFDLVVHSAV